MRKLEPKDLGKKEKLEHNIFLEYAGDLALDAHNRDWIIQKVITGTASLDKFTFYPLIGEIFTFLGYNCSVTRDGDTNNRSDAYLIDDTYSIPIEIKSPTEIPYINNKSIRQAVENKIVLLSRNFFPTTRETTSLAIGYTYPAQRSGVFDLIEDVYSAYKFNIGIISLRDLLNSLWSVLIEGKPFDKNRISLLKGQFK